MAKPARPWSFAPIVLAPLVLAAAAACVAVGGGACSTAVGTTPSCVADLDGGGQPPDGGCTGFAVCTNDAGMAMDPHVCCNAIIGDSGDTMGLELCLYTYGDGPAPSPPKDGGASTTSGTGGAGGKATTTTGAGGKATTTTGAH